MGPIGAIVAILGGVLSAVGTISAANQQASAQEANAQIAETQAKEALFQSQEAARLKRRQLSKLLGKQKAGFAKGGVITSEGTPLLVTEETRQEGQRDIDLTLRAGNIESMLLRNRAAGFRASAKNTRTAGILGAASSVLGSVGTSGLLKGGGGGVKFNKGFEATIRQPMGHT